MEGGSDLCLQRSALRKYLRHVYSRLPDRESRLQGHEASGRVAARRRDLQVLGSLGVLAGHCGESSPAKSSTPCRARRAPSSCRTPSGNSTSTQASLVWTGEPRAMHVCSARTQPLAGIAVPPCGIQRQRIVQEPSPWRGIVVPPPCCARRDSSGPFVAARVMPRKQQFRIRNQSL